MSSFSVFVVLTTSNLTYSQFFFDQITTNKKINRFRIFFQHIQISMDSRELFIKKQKVPQDKH